MKRQRQIMVVNQLMARNITHTCILKAMATVPREQFVDASLRTEAYGDYPLPIGFGQTISQPYIVARACELAEFSGQETVLDIGTGSGYQAAIISRCIRQVITIERIPVLARQAKSRLKKLHLNNVTVLCGDGCAGVPQQGPYDVIIAAAASRQPPQAWLQQLTPQGRIIMPIITDTGQYLTRFTISGQELKTETYGSVAFVPLVSPQPKIIRS